MGQYTTEAEGFTRGIGLFSAFFPGKRTILQRSGAVRTRNSPFCRCRVRNFASVAGFVLCGMTDCLFYGVKPLQFFMLVLGLSQAVYMLYNNKNKPEGENK